MVAITLSNASDSGNQAITIEAQVESAQWFFSIPASLAHQLNLSQIDQREVHTDEGKTTHCPYVGPIAVRHQNRTCFTGAIVYGETVRLGASVMAELAPGPSPNPKSCVELLPYTESERVQSLTPATAHADELPGKSKRGTAKGILSRIKPDVQVSDEESRQSALEAKHDKK